MLLCVIGPPFIFVFIFMILILLKKCNRRKNEINKNFEKNLQIVMITFYYKEADLNGK